MLGARNKSCTCEDLIHGIISQNQESERNKKINFKLLQGLRMRNETMQVSEPK
jgi:hypothetical protein